MNNKNIVPWNPVLKPGQLTESRLIKAFLDGTFPINSNLPGERELAVLLGITRPTLREALQRLERDGWVQIRHGKPTRIQDFWVEGNLGVTIALAQYQDPLPHNFIADLFSVRVLLAPTYTSAAVNNAPVKLSRFLSTIEKLSESASSFSRFDWELHWQLTIHAGSPFFTHFINSVKRLYKIVGIPYFSYQKTRDHSRLFYNKLLELAINKKPDEAGELSKHVMVESAALWAELSKEGTKNERPALE